MIALPSTWWVIAAGAALAFAVGLAAGSRFEHVRMAGKLAELRADHTALVASAERAAAEAERAEREKERQRVVAAQEVNHVARIALDRVSDDRRAADAAGQRLRLAARAAAAGACEGSQGAAAAGDGAPTAGAGLVLAIVLGRADERAGELAAAYDAARIAGEACERAYQSVIDTQ